VREKPSSSNVAQSGSGGGGGGDDKGDDRKFANDGDAANTRESGEGAAGGGGGGGGGGEGDGGGESQSITLSSVVRDDAVGVGVVEMGSSNRPVDDWAAGNWGWSADPTAGGSKAGGGGAGVGGVGGSSPGGIKSQQGMAAAAAAASIKGDAPLNPSAQPWIPGGSKTPRGSGGSVGWGSSYKMPTWWGSAR
jgi:hypothetical protein